MIMYATLLHDTIDHKYTNNLNEKISKLNNFLIQRNKYTKYVEWIINNISYSKEFKSGYPIHIDTRVNLARDIVSDADKLEAIGQIQELRMILLIK